MTKYVVLAMNARKIMFVRQNMNNIVKKLRRRLVSGDMVN